MKQRRICGFIFVMILFVSVAAMTTTVPCQAKTKNKFVTKSGKTYYYGDKGKKLKNGLYEVKKKTYYFDEKGVMYKGWKKIKGDYYYFSRKDGKMLKNHTVDGIKIKKSGTVKKTKYNESKIQTMIKARKLMQSITKPSDSKQTKLKKCFDWIIKLPYRRYRMLKPIYKTKGWEMTFANDIFDNKMGCCVSNSAALAFLAHECGYETVYVAHDTGHAWTEIDGKVYDTLFAEVKSYKKYFGGSYKTAGLYRVDRRKI